MDTDRKAWLERRRLGIGGSDVAGILGLSPWSSPWKVWSDKVGLSPLDEQATDAMEFGQRAEPMMAGYFTDRTGLVLAGEQMELEHPDIPWMRCTVDGLVMESGTRVLDGHLSIYRLRTDVPNGQLMERVSVDDALGVHEIKTTSKSAAEWEDEIPAHYQCQAQWSMAVSGLHKVWFSVLHLAFGRPTYRVYELDRNETDIALIVERCREFWHDHVLTGVPPEVDEREVTTDALNSAWPDPAGQLETTPEVEDLLLQIQLAEEDVDAAKAKRDLLKNRLRALMGANSELVAYEDGKPRNLVTYRVETRNLIDAGAVRKAHGDKYDRPSESRVLRIPAFRRIQGVNA